MRTKNVSIFHIFFQNHKIGCKKLSNSRFQILDLDEIRDPNQAALNYFKSAKNSQRVSCKEHQFVILKNTSL